MEESEDILNDAVWAGIAQQVEDGDYGLEEQTEFYGRRIADCVIAGRLALADLRACVQYANSLDREISVSADCTKTESETVARRVFHASTKTALNLVKSRRRRVDHAVDYGKRRRALVGEALPGMGRPEGKDLYPESFVV